LNKIFCGSVSLLANSNIKVCLTTSGLGVLVVGVSQEGRWKQELRFGLFYGFNFNSYVKRVI